MSRVGKNPVNCPADVQCRLEGNSFYTKGKLGELRMPIVSDVDVAVEANKVFVTPKNESKFACMMWGTTRKLINNLVQGVSNGFTKELEITGVGYRAAVQGSNLVLQLGYSHDVIFPIPEGIIIKCEKPTSVTITGIDRQKVGQIAAEIRSYRPPEPYKGKGIKYKDERILRKEGKKK